MDDAPHDTIIEVSRLTKQFPAVCALDEVSLSIRRGSVHGVIGENGAGKSTLMKVISGLNPPTSGQLSIDGQSVNLSGPRDALALGVAMIHQELNLVDELSVADNIFLGREHRGRLGLIDQALTVREAAEWMAQLHWQGHPRTKIRHLSIAEKQLVEIAKALSCRAHILLMDEPTSVLTERETEALFELIANLKSRGVTVIYISHILSEVLQVCDTITVMRDGRIVETVKPEEASEQRLASLMVGRELSDMFPQRQPPSDESVLEVRGLSSPGMVHDVSFELRQGEILGFAGLVGSGRTEAAEALVGLRKRSAGLIRVRGQEVNVRRAQDAVQHKMAYLSEDRKGRGLHVDLDVITNTTLVNLRAYCRPLIDSRAEEKTARSYVDQLGIRVGRLRAPLSNLSGGNQQKVAIAKWLDTGPDILILDEPTRGIDVSAKREIYFLIKKLADAGKSCILISSELPELLGLCHRIAVMRSGRVVATMDGSTATEDDVMQYAAGVKGAQAA